MVKIQRGLSISNGSSTMDEWDTIIGDEEDDAGGVADLGKMDALEQRIDSMERLLQTIAQQVSEIHANRA